MNRQGRMRVPVLVCAIAALVLATAGNAGLVDSFKKKATDKANKKAEETTDKALQGAEKSATPGAKPAEGAAPAAAAEEAGSSGKGTGSGKVNSVSTKFDYVPGDSVIFMDDFTQDELGEFPARWDLKQGTYEVAEMEGTPWLRCVSPDARIMMKLPAMTSLPEFWTFEFDFYAAELPSGSISVRGLTDSDRQAWEVVFFNGPAVVFRSGDLFSSTPIEGELPGRHHMMFMARGKALKVYLDRERMVNVPDVSAEAGMPNMLEFRMFMPSKPMITNVRFAEGCKPPKDMLATGKLVTHGIRFATGSDVVQPESAPVLRQVAGYLEKNPTVRLKITGHTDNVGSAASNLDLSKRRAASVAKVLSTEFGVAADRFETDGKGDTQAMASNAKPEGKAMNRRVEFAKL